jgi:hypothetical protein
MEKNTNKKITLNIYIVTKIIKLSQDLHLISHSFIRSFILLTLSEHLLCARHSVRCCVLWIQRKIKYLVAGGEEIRMLIKMVYDDMLQ